MVERILIPLDRSEGGEAAIPFGALLARTLGAEVVLLTVVEAEGTDQAERNREALRYLRQVTTTYPEVGSASVTVRAGVPGNEILRIVEDEPHALIVMATHGRGGLERALLGSVADRVVRTASVPVALVRSAGPEEQRRSMAAVRTVLVPLDGSALAELAVPLAIDVARHAGAVLHLTRSIMPVSMGYSTGLPGELMVVPQESYDELMAELQQEARDYLEQIADRCGLQGVVTVTHVVIGTPVDSLLGLADEVGADMIVMATHGRGGMRRLVLGSVATGVTQRSQVPVLVVPARSQDTAREHVRAEEEDQAAEKEGGVGC